jgi:glycosyltransferase involved in cell wall biosynthesis
MLKFSGMRMALGEDLPVPPVHFAARLAKAGDPVIEGKKLAVVMPAYNAAKTLRATVRELPRIVDAKILVDDHSGDETVRIARELGLQVIVHEKNYGYGGNQKTCYLAALDSGADIIIMVHPDYQYKPTLVAAMAGMISSGVYDVVLGSRILGGGALRGGMPRYKYIANRLLTAFENLFLGAKLSEYHTGFRGFTREVLERLPLAENSDDFVFDNEMIVQMIYFGFRIGEISCPTKYFDEASSIRFGRSVRYGVGVLAATLKYFFQRLGLAHSRILDPNGRKLTDARADMPASTQSAEQAVERAP